MANNQFDILIRYLSDVAGSKAGADKVIADYKRIEEAGKKAQATLNKAFTVGGVSDAEITKASKAVDDYAKGREKILELNKQTIITLQAEARELRSIANAIKSDTITAQIGRLRAVSSQIGAFSGAALGLGLGVTGGIFAAASKYVKDAKEATAVTVQWKAAQDSLEKSGSKIGAVLAQEALPVLKQAAEVAGRVADFVESHPDAVRAALNVGLVTATLGAIGLAVSKGIKIYADAVYLSTIPAQLTAAKLQDLAADKQLAAAGLKARGLGIDEAANAIPKKDSSILKSVPILAAILGGAALFGGIGRAASNFGAKQAGFESPEDFWQKTLEKLGLVKSEADKAADSLGDAAGNLGSAKNSPAFEGVLKAYEDYRADDLKLVQDHYKERQSIISDSLAAEQASNAHYAASVTKINTQTSSALTQAATQFATANANAETKLAQDRSKIIEEGDKDIAKIQQAGRDRLRKLEQDHADRAGDLTAARDALGLAKENRRFREARAEELRSTGQEVKQRRQEIAQRLADLQRSYEEEKAQRAADYAARVLEIQANARQQLAELAEQHRQELAEIQAQKAARLRELDNQFNEERKRRYAYLVQQIRDLDASLLGERNLKTQYQNAMLVDLDRFLAAERDKRAASYTTTATPTGQAAGGYASYGTYRLGDTAGGGRGPREYVLSGNTTQMAEKLLGGNLTQDRLLAALGGGGKSGQSVTYNDGRRIDSRVSSADRNRMRDDVLGAVLEALQ